MKLNSSLKFLFISFLAISFIAGLGLFSGLSYLKETTYGVSERTIAENIRSLTKEAALYRDAQGINEILSAIYKKGYYFRVSLPDNFTVIYPKDLFSPIWKEKPDHIIQSQTASKELLIIEVWDTNDNTPLVWQIFMWGIPSMLLVLLVVSYWVLKQIDGDVKAVEKYLETGSKKVLGAVKFNFFQYLVSLLIKSETLKKQLFDAEKENQKRKEISDFAELICHDIRSPLEALKFLSSTQEFKKSEERELLDSVVKRIEAIIESLNKKRTNKRESFDLLPYIKNLISEKKIEFKDLDVRFDFESFDLDVPIYIEGDVYVLMRGLSNIINNSVEAMVPHRQLQVKLSVEIKDGYVQISISDNGKGIPAKVISKLGYKGISYGKKSGTGLGLYAIRAKVEMAGGRFNIDSIEDVGTDVCILYPVVGGKGRVTHASQA